MNSIDLFILFPSCLDTSYSSYSGYFSSSISYGYTFSRHFYQFSGCHWLFWTQLFSPPLHSSFSPVWTLATLLIPAIFLHPCHGPCLFEAFLSILCLSLASLDSIIFPNFSFLLLSCLDTIILFQLFFFIHPFHMLVPFRGFSLNSLADIGLSGLHYLLHLFILVSLLVPAIFLHPCHGHNFLRLFIQFSGYL